MSALLDSPEVSSKSKAVDDGPARGSASSKGIGGVFVPLAGLKAAKSLSLGENAEVFQVLLTSPVGLTVFHPVTLLQGGRLSIRRACPEM